MTTCEECLSALSTAKLSDINPGSAIAVHCYTCPQCNRVAEEVRYAEYRLAASLNEEAPSAEGRNLAAYAILESERLRRRRIARWIRGGLAVVAMGLFGAAMETMREDDNPMKTQDLVIETLELRCLPPQAALDLVTPYLRSHGTAVYRADDVHAITLRGKSSEVAAAKLELERFDTPDRCRIPATGPAPATADGTPGKD
ncbi:MAG: hypothetical protein ABI681_09740 [Gemmatimonadales bacterium]